MLTELCAELKNYFLRDREADIHYGEYTISGGSIDLPFLLNGQYFRIVGSVFNDGIHQYPADDLKDETFEGAVWALGIPKDVINLAAEIAEWRSKYEAVDSAAMSPFSSESFGGYSYSKSGTGSADGGGTTGGSWKTAFMSRMNAWRKL